MYKWDKLKAPNLFGQRCDKMSTQYDFLARQILEGVDISKGTPDIIALAKKYGIEVLSSNRYLTKRNEPEFTFYSPYVKGALSAENEAILNPHMPYHLLLATPSPSECREWIAYYIVLVFMFQKKMISSYFLMTAMCGNLSLRNDTFHRFATSILIPEQGLRKWGWGENNFPSRFALWNDVTRQEAAIHFAVPREVVDIRLNLYNTAGAILPPSLMNNLEGQISNEG